MTEAFVEGLDPALRAVARDCLPAILDYEHGWNRADAEHMFRAASEDITQVNIIGMFWIGKAAVVRAHAALFGSVLKGVGLRLIGIDHLRRLGSDGLVAVVRWRVGGFSLPDAAKPEADNLMTMVFADHDGAWRLSHVANIEVVEALAAANPIK